MIDLNRRLPNQEGKNEKEGWVNRFGFLVGGRKNQHAGW